jgi:quercetin dioxygenase-like cupin family protein
MRKHLTRLKAALGLVPLLVLVFGMSALWIARAQQADDDPRFTGLSTSLDTEGLRVSHRRFEAGARSAWHRHPYGQLLFVQEGRARTQKRGRPMREMGVGESDYTGPNVEHWHGAAPHVHYIQVAVGFGEGIEWLEKVTDEEYDGL